MLASTEGHGTSCKNRIHINNRNSSKFSQRSLHCDVPADFWSRAVGEDLDRIRISRIWEGISLDERLARHCLQHIQRRMFRRNRGVRGNQVGLLQRILAG